jgi:hypothetical protein
MFFQSVQAQMSLLEAITIGVNTFLPLYPMNQKKAKVDESTYCKTLPSAATKPGSRDSSPEDQQGC